MADGIEVKVEGIQQLSARFKALSVGMRIKGVRAAMRKGANVVRDAAKAGARAIDRPETPLSIEKNVAVSFDGKRLKRTGDVGFRVGIRGGAKQYADTKENRRGRRVGQTYKTGGSTFYWRFIEFGTSSIRARPFLRPAIENNTDKVMGVIVAEMNRQLDRFAKKGIT